MAKYICSVCGFIYDEAEGIPDAGVAAGTRRSEDRRVGKECRSRCSPYH